VTPAIPAPKSREVPAAHEFVSGWKEIADYLRKGVRTVQRYERQLLLPIHRPAGKSKGSVIATKSELDGWVTGDLRRPSSSQKNRIAEQTNRLGADFLRIDSDIALTFCRIALNEQNEGRRQSATRTARRAYDTITHLRKGIHLTDAETTKLDSNLQRLKSELRKIDEVS